MNNEVLCLILVLLRNTAPPRPPGQREEPAPNPAGGDQWVSGFEECLLIW